MKNLFRVYDKEDGEHLTDADGKKYWNTLAEAVAVVNEACDGSDTLSHDMFKIQDTRGSRWTWTEDYACMHAPAGGRYEAVADFNVYA